jgi:dihydroorotate dehydrogenase
MGFNNEGVDVVATRLKFFHTTDHPAVVVGGNIGKNKNTPNEKAIDDYEICFEKLFDHVDYFVVNVSSPNTPGLRALQEKEPLKQLLLRLNEINHQHEKPRPILLKIAPDLSNEQLNDIVEIVLETKLAGIIATNTTVSRSGLNSDSNVVQAFGQGGLSGTPLNERSTEVIRYLKEISLGKFVIIGVGGIHSAKDALEKLDAGADLVQLYTGMIYEGPSLMKKINNAMMKRKSAR